MKSLLKALLIVGSIVGTTTAVAEENWSPHLSGLREGLASGALPPVGLYLLDDTLVTSAPYRNDSGDSAAGITVQGIVNVPELLWVPDVHLLGGQYAFAIAQPFDRADTLVAALGPYTGFDKTGLYDTYVAPVNISWKLPNHLYLLAGLGVYIADGNFTTPAQYPGLSNSIGFWSIEPRVSISYLNNGWTLNANITYDKNFKNTATDYTSGGVLNVDYTLMKDVAKWEVGVGGYATDQVTDDVQNGVTVSAVPGYRGVGNRMQKYAIGPIVGYKFGHVILQARYNAPLYAANTVQGSEFWTRLVIAF
jgi:hypothetical protein